MEFQKLKNGDAKTTTGSKQVSFDPETLELRPVLFRVYSGYVPSRGTVQGVKDGDIIASVVWGKNFTDYRLFFWTSTDFSLSEQANLWVRLREKHPWLDAWLEPSGRGETNIPFDVVPESEYLSNKIKWARVSAAISRFGLPFKTEEFMECRKFDLNLNPRKLDIDLSTYESEENHWDGELVNIHQFEEWYGCAGNGSPAVPLVHNSKYVSGSNYAHSETFTRKGVPGVVGWEKWRFLIRIQFGTVVSNHSSHGKKVDIWENSNTASIKTDKAI